MSAFPYKKLAVRIRFALCHKDIKKFMFMSQIWPPQRTARSSLLSHFYQSLLGAQSKKSSHAALNSKMANAQVLRSPLRKLFVKP